MGCSTFFERDEPHRLGAGRIAEEPIAVDRHDDVALAGLTAHATADVHGVADDVVLAPLAAADVRSHDLARVHADAEVHRGDVHIGEPFAQQRARPAWIAIAQSRVTCGWFSTGSGAPNTANTSSPTNFSTVPLCSRMMSVSAS